VKGVMYPKQFDINFERAIGLCDVQISALFSSALLLFLCSG
jgi:hypothetical protein